MVFYAVKGATKGLAGEGEVGTVHPRQLVQPPDPAQVDLQTATALTSQQFLLKEFITKRQVAVL